MERPKLRGLCDFIYIKKCKKRIKHCIQWWAVDFKWWYKHDYLMTDETGVMCKVNKATHICFSD